MIPQIYPGITQVAEPFRGVLLDAYGVFWGGNDYGAFPGAKEAMAKLVAEGKIVGVLSNATQRSAKEIQKLHAHGICLGVHYHFYVTSGEVARALFLHDTLPFKTTHNKFFLFGGVHPKYASHVAIFQDSLYEQTSDISEADFLYISVPHIEGVDQEDPEVFRRWIEEVRPYGLPMVCPNPDPFAHEGNPPRQVVRQGSIAQMYEEMGGEVFYIGKPHAKAYEGAMAHFAHYHITDPADILMVGDSPKTDIRGARKFGMKSALITETGIMGDQVRREGVGALEHLPASDTPDFFLGRFIDDL